MELREVEEIGVQAGHGVAEPVAQPDADRHAEQHDHRGELQVVPGDGEVVVAERLQRRDLAALRVHLPVQHHVEDERRHQQEDRRQHGAEHALLADFLRQDLVRHLVLASHRAEAAVGLEQLVERFHRRLARGAALQAQQHRVEGALHVEGGGERLRVDPQHREPLVVGHAAAARGVDVFGRKHRADQREALELAVQQHVHVLAELEAARFEEALVHHHLALGARRRPAAAPERQAVHAPRAREVVADEARDHRRRHPGNGKLRVAHHARLDLGHARDGVDLLRERRGRALGGGEHVREARRVVVVVARPHQRAVGRERADEAADAAGDHQRDGHHLGLQRPEIPQQLAVEGFHQEISAGVSLRAGFSSPTILPLPRRSTRSAMPEMAALCVITIAVVPSSALILAITSSTSLPVS